VLSDVPLEGGVIDDKGSALPHVDLDVGGVVTGYDFADETLGGRAQLFGGSIAARTASNF
jgi:hypothetical protein